MDITTLNDTLKKVIKDAETSIESIGQNAATDVLDASTAFLVGLETRAADYFNVIADDSEEGKAIDKLAFLKDAFANEKEIFKSELVTYSVIGKQVAEDIINSVIGILTTGLLSVLPAQP